MAINLEKRIKNLPSGIWKKITQIDELKGRWIAGAQLNPQVLGRLKRSVLVTSTGASTRIEGAHLSDEDIEKLMRGVSMQKFADRDKQEVKGYYEFLENVFDAWKTIRFSYSLGSVGPKPAGPESVGLTDPRRKRGSVRHRP